MYTSDFNIFKEMVAVAVTENMEYKVLYSNMERRAANDKPQCFGAILCTNLFKVCYERNLTPEEAFGYEQYLRDKNSVKLNCRISVTDNKIELE